MSLTLHTVSGAPRGWRVLLGLAFKGLDHKTLYLDLSKGDLRSPEFLKLNPRATVPVLETDDLILRDSLGILAWLDRRYPDVPLFGETTDEAALIWQTTLEFCDYLREAVNGLLVPILVLQNPLPAKDSPEHADLKVASEAVHAEYRFVEDLLEGKPFLTGDRPSAADAVAFPEVCLVRRAVETKPDHMSALGFDNLPGLYPRVAEWTSRIGELENVDKTWPRHW